MSEIEVTITFTRGMRLRLMWDAYGAAAKATSVSRWHPVALYYFARAVAGTL